MSIRPPLAVLVLVAAGCNTAGKSDLARKEIGLQASVLMSKGVVPGSQAHFDELTEVAGCPKDPWGAPYVYERLGIRQIRIASKGPDGQYRTQDDVSEDLTFPSGSGMEDYTVVRVDGIKAIRSPNGEKTFWTTERDVENEQLIDYWIGDAAGVSEKPFRSQTVNSNDWRRAVTLARWSRDGRYLAFREVDVARRPDLGENKDVTRTVEVATGTELDSGAVPANAEWMEY